MLIFLSLSFVINVAKLYIQTPNDLKEIFKNQPISYSIANFGHVPYGRSFSGIMDLPSK